MGQPVRGSLIRPWPVRGVCSTRSRAARRAHRAPAGRSGTFLNASGRWDRCRLGPWCRARGSDVTRRVRRMSRRHGTWASAGVFSGRLATLLRKDSRQEPVTGRRVPRPRDPVPVRHRRARRDSHPATWTARRPPKSIRPSQVANRCRFSVLAMERRTRRDRRIRPRVGGAAPDQYRSSSRCTRRRGGRGEHSNSVRPRVGQRRNSHDVL